MRSAYQLCRVDDTLADGAGDKSVQRPHVERKSNHPNAPTRQSDHVRPVAPEVHLGRGSVMNPMRLVLAQTHREAQRAAKVKSISEEYEPKANPPPRALAAMGILIYVDR